MLETLSLGGGVITLNSIDMGFCFGFALSIDVEYIHRDIYLTDGIGGIIRAKSVAGTLSSLQINGSFTCESLDDRSLKTLWMKGDALFSDSDFNPTILPLIFTSTPAVGATYVLDLPYVALTPQSEFSPMDHTWNNIAFEFDVVFDSDTNNLPALNIIPA